MDEHDVGRVAAILQTAAHLLDNLPGFDAEGMYADLRPAAFTVVVSGLLYPPIEVNAVGPMDAPPALR